MRDTADLPVMLLVGGGHAHLRVLQSLRIDRWPPVRTVLLSPSDTHTYSGMVPGFLQEQYRVDEITIDLRALCDAAGAELVTGTAYSVDSSTRTVHSSAGPLLFDLASLDVGSVPEGLDLPGVRDHAVTLRPMGGAVALRARLDALARSCRGGAVRVCVVGGGAGGVEVALATASRFRMLGAQAEIVLVERARAILEGYPPATRRKAEEILTTSGIELVTSCSVDGLDTRQITLSGGRTREVDLVVWLSGAAPSPLLAASSLPLSDDGFFAVDEQLRASNGAPVWGAGDCITLNGRSLPKAGVYAVRQAPVLAANLRASLGSGRTRSYDPQTAFLSILNSGDGRAILRWRRLVAHNRAAWWLKDRIDRRFVRRYQLERR